MSVQGIIFDLYGVLGLNGWQEFKQLHFGDDWNRWEPLRRLGQRVDAGEASDDEFVAAIAHATGESDENVRYQFEHTQPNFELLDFIRQELKPRYKIGLLSNSSRDVLPGIFSEEQRALFDASVMSVSVGLTKPDPMMFYLICDELSLAPEQCVMIDDQARHLAPAQAVGMKTLLYTSTEQIIPDLTSILKND